MTSELVLMGRSLNACKILVKISSEVDALERCARRLETMILNQLRKAVDNALLQGNATAGITGLIPQAGTVVKHSRFVADGVTNTTTTVTSATAAFTSADVGSFVTGAGIPAGATIASVTNATTIVLSAAATATATGVVLTFRPTMRCTTAWSTLTAAQDAYADPKFWIIDSQTIGVLRKLKDTMGHPLLSPDTTVQGAEMILGRTVLPAPSAALPHGVAMLVDPRTIHVAVDVAGYMRIALEAFIATTRSDFSSSHGSTQGSRSPQVWW